MVIPYYENIVNESKYGKFDMYERDKFIGFIMPNGKIFECTSAHGFGAGLISLIHFFDCYLLWDKEKEYEENIQLIKKYIPLSERPKYFK